MRLLRGSSWRDYLPEIHRGGDGPLRHLGISLGNRNCDPLLWLEVEYHSLWTDVGDAIGAALRERKYDDFREFGITWQMLLAEWIDAVSRDLSRQIEQRMSDALRLGPPDQVLMDDPTDGV